MTGDQQLARHYEAALKQILHLRALYADAADFANAALEIARRALAARCAHGGAAVRDPDSHACDAAQMEHDR